MSPLKVEYTSENNTYVRLALDYQPVNIILELPDNKFFPLTLRSHSDGQIAAWATLTENHTLGFDTDRLVMKNPRYSTSNDSPYYLLEAMYVTDEDFKVEQKRLLKKAVEFAYRIE